MIRPCLTFVDRAEEAVKFYVSVFPKSKIVSMQRVESDGGPIPKGKLLNATFELDGREYLAFDGGPSFTFTEGISLMVMCKTQQEVDNYWTKLTETAARKDPAAGSRTGSVFRGRSCPRCWARCSATRSPATLMRPCRRCSR